MLVHVSVSLSIHLGELAGFIQPVKRLTCASAGKILAEEPPSHEKFTYCVGGKTFPWTHTS